MHIRCCEWCFIMFSLLYFFLLGIATASLVVQGFSTPGQVARTMCGRYRDITKVNLRVNPIDLTTDNCNRPVDLIRIVGGQDAKPGEFPHQAALGWESGGIYRFFCGGSLISDQFVLTAAHCKKQLGQSPKIVRLGVVDLTSTNAQDVEIESFTSHQNYRKSASYNDIALVKLIKPVSLLPACLWTSTNEDLGHFIATGFGYTEQSGSVSNILQKVQLELVDRKECMHQFRYDRRFRKGIAQSQMCVGSTQANRDTCQGDSGGPIQVIAQEGECVYHVVGVTSAGSGCGGSQSQAIYTRVASYIDWIENEVWGGNVPE